MDDFFTVNSFATLAGSVLCVVVLVNTIRHVFNWGPRWFSLLLSIAVSFVAFSVTSELGDGPKTVNNRLLNYLIVVLNGCLIYSSAFGLQNTIVAPGPSGSGLRLQSASGDESISKRLTFNSEW